MRNEYAQTRKRQRITIESFPKATFALIKKPLSEKDKDIVRRVQESLLEYDIVKATIETCHIPDNKKDELFGDTINGTEILLKSYLDTKLLSEEKKQKSRNGQIQLHSWIIELNKYLYKKCLQKCNECIEIYIDVFKAIDECNTRNEDNAIDIESIEDIPTKDTLIVLFSQLQMKRTNKGYIRSMYTPLLNHLFSNIIEKLQNIKKSIINYQIQVTLCIFLIKAWEHAKNIWKNFDKETQDLLEAQNDDGQLQNDECAILYGFNDDTIELPSSLTIQTPKELYERNSEIYNARKRLEEIEKLHNKELKNERIELDSIIKKEIQKRRCVFQFDHDTLFVTPKVVSIDYTTDSNRYCMDNENYTFENDTNKTDLDRRFESNSNYLE